MYFLLFLLLALSVFIYLLLTIPVKVALICDSDHQMQLSMFWLNSFLEITVKMKEFTPFFSISIFKRCVYSAMLKNGKGKNRNAYFKALKLRNVHVKAYYGLNDPFLMGIIYGIAEWIHAFVNIEKFEQFPEFISAKEFVSIEADCNFVPGTAIIALIRTKTSNYKTKRRDHYGPVKFG